MFTLFFNRKGFGFGQGDMVMRKEAFTTVGNSDNGHIVPATGGAWAKCATSSLHPGEGALF